MNDPGQTKPVQVSMIITKSHHKISPEILSDNFHKWSHFLVSCHALRFCFWSIWHLCSFSIILLGVQHLLNLQHWWSYFCHLSIRVLYSGTSKQGPIKIKDSNFSVPDSPIQDCRLRQNLSQLRTRSTPLVTQLPTRSWIRLKLKYDCYTTYRNQMSMDTMFTMLMTSS